MQAQESLTRRLRRALASGHANSDQVSASMARLEFTSHLDALDTADFVIEAVLTHIGCMFAAQRCIPLEWCLHEQAVQQQLTTCDSAP